MSRNLVCITDNMLVIMGILEQIFEDYCHIKYSIASRLPYSTHYATCVCVISVKSL